MLKDDINGTKFGGMINELTLEDATDYYEKGINDITVLMGLPAAIATIVTDGRYIQFVNEKRTSI
jgi:hypothetical protein